MKTLVSTALAGAILAELTLRVDQQQFHHQYTRIVMIMVLGVASCGLLAVCGVVAILLRRSI